MDTAPSEVFFKKGQVYFFLCASLVAGGKSNLFQTVLDLTKTEFSDTIKVFYVSSDQIRGELMLEYIQKHPQASEDEAFEKVQKAANAVFDKNIRDYLKESDLDKVNIILVDKNFPNGVDGFFKSYCQKKHVIILFHPNIRIPVKLGKFDSPFSYNYIFQCYLRLKNRTGHETLDLTKNSNGLYVFLSFLKLFHGTSFSSSNDRIILKSVSFTDESNEEIESQVPNGIKKFFSKIVTKIKPFDMQKIAQFEKEILVAFKLIDDNYPFEMFADTRPILREELKQFLSTGDVVEVKDSMENKKGVDDDESLKEKEKEKETESNNVEEKMTGGMNHVV